MEIVSNSAQETGEFAKDIFEKIKQEHDVEFGAAVVALYGELGTGKTTFVKFLGEVLGVKEHITSPTFVLLKKYKTKDFRFKNLIHIDAYRIEKKSELEGLGWDELINNPENIICIEWPVNIEELLPKHHVRVKIEHRLKNSRTITTNK